MEELIKLAKEKGFKGKTVTTKYTIEVILGNRKNVLVNNICNYSVLCEIQKWLREVHNIEVFIIPTHISYLKNKSYKTSLEFFNGVEIVNTDYTCYNTYEQALEAGLLEIIKSLTNFVN